MNTTRGETNNYIIIIDFTTINKLIAFYYTDVGSTFLVLFMYCLSLDGRDWMASFIGKLRIVLRFMS